MDEYDSAVQSVWDDVDGSLNEVVPTAETYELGCDIKVHTRSHVIDNADSMLNGLVVPDCDIVYRIESYYIYD